MITPTIARHIEVADRVLNEQSFTYTCAFISGSVVENFANSTSDVDLYVLAPAPELVDIRRSATATYQHASISLFFVDGGKVDAEIWDIDQVRHLLEITKGLGDTTQDISAILSDVDLQLLHRIRVGVGLRGKPEFEALRSSADWRALAHLIAQRAERTYNGFAEDAIGAIRATEGLTAMLTSRMALESAVDYVTAAHGSTNTKPKWRAARLKALGLDTVLEQFGSAEIDASSDTAALLEQSKSRLRVASNLVSAAAEQLAVS